MISLLSQKLMQVVARDSVVKHVCPNPKEKPPNYKGSLLG